MSSSTVVSPYDPRRLHAGRSRPSIALLPLLLALAAAAAPAQDLTLTPVDDRSAQDNGQADGTFDMLLTDSEALTVVDNGFIEIRAALEFDISGLTVVPGVARLVLVGGSTEARRIAAHGYTAGADGMIALADFAHDDLQSESGPISSLNTVVDLDVTAIVSAAVNASSTYVGFNVRETTTGTLSMVFGSRNASVALQPRLEIFYLFADGFESGDVSAWSSATP